MTVESLKPALCGVVDQLGLELSDSVLNQLLDYLELLGRWNETYNLTSIRDAAQMLTQHLADCLAVVQPLRTRVDRLGLGVRLLDVGTGGGLPGIVIAATCPQIEVVCVDAVGKKAAFIRQVAAELRMKNLVGQHARVEELREPRFDVISSRAFSTLGKFVALTRPLLKPAGLWMAMKGKRPDAELAELPSTAAMFHVEPVVVPGLSAERCLVWMSPAG